MTALAAGRPAVAAYFLLAVTSLIWAGNSTIGRALRDDTSPLALGVWRWVLALAILAPFVWPEMRERWPVIRRHWRILLVVGLLSTGVHNTLAFVALQYTVALHLQLFNSIIPIAVMLALWAIEGARPTRTESVGFVVSLLGVLAIVSHGDPMRLARLEFNVGDLIALGIMLTWGLYTALVKRCPRELTPSGLTFVTGFVGLLPLLPLYAIEVAQQGGVAPMSAPVIGGILYYAILSSVLATVFLTYGIQRVGPPRASLFTHLVPVFGAILSVSLLGEPLALHHLAGFALVLAGLALCNRLPLR